MKEKLRYQSHIIYLDEIILQIAKKLDLVDDTEYVLQLVEAVLLGIRKRLPFPKALQFLMALPMQLRAIFIEQWRISEFLPHPLESFSDFIEEIVQLRPDLFAPGAKGHMLAEQAVLAIVETISDHTSPDMFHQMIHVFPEPVQEHLICTN